MSPAANPKDWNICYKPVRDSDADDARLEQPRRRRGRTNLHRKYAVYAMQVWNSKSFVPDIISI